MEFTELGILENSSLLASASRERKQERFPF